METNKLLLELEKIRHESSIAQVEYNVFINNLFKRSIIPQITIFEECLKFLNDYFYELEIINKVSISEKIDTIASLLEYDFDDIRFFNLNCEDLIKEQNEYQDDDFDENTTIEEETCSCSNKEFSEDERPLDYEEHYFRKTISNNNSSYNESFDDENKEVY